MNPETQMVRVRGFDLIIPWRTHKLLFISNDNPKDSMLGFRFERTIDPISREVIPQLIQLDPSTIFTRMSVQKPQDPTAIPRPGYYPTYQGLTPEQKWIYLNWLSS